MTVDNTELIRNHLRFYSDDMFYFVQILKRRKENPEMEKGVKVVDSFYINSIESFDRKLPMIKELCEKHNARAYINLNELSHEKVTYEIISILINGLRNHNYKAWMGAGNSACGQVKAAKEKLWLVDLDGDDVDKIPEITDYINAQPPFVEEDTGDPIVNKVILVVPTKNGKHMMVRPFDKRDFNRKYPNIEIHKDNPTLLYVA